MAIEVVMPRLGWGGEEGSLVEWIKHDGDQVHVGDVLCTVEGDKAVSEVESLDSGILRIPPDSPRPGTKVPVGTILAYLIAPGETAPFEQTATVQATTAVSAESAIPLPVMTVPMAPATATPRATRQGSPAISPRAWRVAEELGVNWTALQGSGSSGRIVERDVRRAAAEATVQRAEAQIGPLARRTAAEASADLEALAQAKTGQQITRADVEAAARTRNVAPPASQNAATPDTEPIDLSIRRTPLSSVRQIIARRLDESARTTVPVTLTTEADATDLVRLRAQIKVDLTDTNLPVPSYNDLLAKLVALALQEHPELNSSLDGQEIVQHTRINVGIAVDTERGLLVPVIHDVPEKSILRIATESAQLIEQARSGQISPEALRGGTFTLTNLGMYDIDAFTPVVNLPECAILGIGRIVAKPVVVNEPAETITVRKMMPLSLTFDHRLVDGAPAARFLKRVKHFVEHPMLGLIR